MEKQYDIAKKYLPAPLKAYDLAKAQYDEDVARNNISPLSAHYRQWLDNHFVEECLELIELANATGDKLAAQEIRKRAASVVDDPRLREAQQKTRRSGTPVPDVAVPLPYEVRHGVPDLRVCRRLWRLESCHVMKARHGISLLAFTGGHSLQRAAIRYIVPVVARAAMDVQGKTEEALAIFRAIVNSSRDAIAALTLDGAITTWNAGAERLYGYTADEAIGQPVWLLVPPDRSEEMRALLAKIEQGESVESFDTVRRRKDGSLVDVCLTLSPITDASGRTIGASGIIRDITERKRAEEAVALAKREWERTFDSMPDLVTILDVNHRIVRVNRAMAERLGVTPEQCAGRSCFESVHGLDRPPEFCPHTLSVADGREHSAEIHEELLGGDFLVTTTPLLDEQGNVFGSVHVAHDITERKKAREALEKEHRSLKHLLQSSDHERQMIAYEIHDGLAQQLAGAIMQFQASSYLKDTKPDEAARAYEAGMTMLRQGHLEARRLISGVRPPILDESGIVAAVAHLVSEERLQTGPQIEFHSDVAFDRLVPILENAIYRIVQEGLTNACRYSQSQRVRIELVEHDDVLQIKVQDWGQGFDPARVEAERFGLEGIRQRARLLGGSASVESSPGKGTCLTVELPLVLKE